MLVYGEADSGKTTLAIQCAVNCARMGYKTIFIDCDNTFFPRRMAQIAFDDFETFASQIILMKPEDFDQQTFVIDRLSEYVSKKVALIAVDSVTGLYREKLGSDIMKTFALNRELNRQMAYLAQIAKTQKVACLVASQVRSVVFAHVGERELVQPVATRVLKFWADTIISLKPTSKSNIVKAEVRTHTGKESYRQMFLRIEEKGLHDFKR